MDEANFFHLPDYGLGFNAAGSPGTFSAVGFQPLDPATPHAYAGKHIEFDPDFKIFIGDDCGMCTTVKVPVGQMLTLPMGIIQVVPVAASA